MAGTSSTQLASIQAASTRAIPWRLITVVVIILIALPIAWSRRPVPKAMSGGHELVLPWSDKAAVDAVDLGGVAGERSRFEHDGQRLEAVYFESPPPITKVGRLFAANFPLANGRGYGLIDAKRAASVQIIELNGHLWVLSASAEDNGVFANSDAAHAFFASFEHR